MPAPVAGQFPPPDQQRVTLQQNQGGNYSWTWTDSSGSAISLAGKSVKLSAYDPITLLGAFQSGNATISGTGNNTATIGFTAAETAAAQVLGYELLDVTDNVPICTGTLDIQPVRPATLSLGSLELDVTGTLLSGTIANGTAPFTFNTVSGFSLTGSQAQIASGSITGSTLTLVLATPIATEVPILLNVPAASSIIDSLGNTLQGQSGVGVTNNSTVLD